MEKHRLFNADLFWVLVSLSLSFIFLLLVFQSNMFTGSFDIIDGRGVLHFPRLYASVLVMVFTCFLVYCIKGRYPAFASRYGSAMTRLTGLGYISIAAILNLVMILFTISTLTYEPTGLGEMPEIFMPNIMVIGILSVSKLVVLVLLLRTVFKKDRALA